MRARLTKRKLHLILSKENTQNQLKSAIIYAKISPWSNEPEKILSGVLLDVRQTARHVRAAVIAPVAQELILRLH
jgi:hypothetical protein